MRHLLASLALVVLAACSSSEDPEGTGSSSTSSSSGSSSPSSSSSSGETPDPSVIGPGGGSVTLPSGVRIVVPAGALASPTKLSFESKAAPASASVGANPIGQMVEAGPDGTTFAKPVTIVVPYDKALVPAGADVSLAHIRTAPSGSTNFVALDSTVDPATSTIRATTLHFSVFVPVMPIGAGVLITTSPTLPSGTVGANYSQQLTVAVGAGVAVSWAVAPGSTLPSGLSLSVGGQISGTPTTAGTSSFAIKATIGPIVVEKTFTVTVDPALRPAPVLTAVSPTTAQADGQPKALTLTGSGFVSTSKVQWDAADVATTFTSATGLAATVPSAVVTVGTHKVRVFTPAPGGGTSAELDFVVAAVPLPNPVPVVTSISPTTAPANGQPVALTVNGSSFTATSKVRWDNSDLTTTFTSATQLSATVASALVTVGTHKVRVSTPAPGGGTSAPSDFVVTVAPNPAPVVTTISPTTAQANTAVSLTVNGSSFLAASKVQWDGGDVATTFVSATQMTANIPSALVVVGTHKVRVSSPAPGGGPSNELDFVVTQVAQNPAPVVTSISPTTAQANGQPVTLTVSGSSFVAASKVQWDGANVTTSFTSATQLSATVAASLVTVGTHKVRVVTPAPGGGTSAEGDFIVSAVGGPIFITTAAQLPSGKVGSAYTPVQLAVTGGTPPITWSIPAGNSLPAGLTLSASGQLGGTPTSAGAASFLIRAADASQSVQKSFSITVDPADNPAPTLSSVSPATAPAGFTTDITISGGQFIASSIALWDGGQISTTFVSATQLSAQIPISVMTGGTHKLSVQNPAPGGGTSAELDFVVTGSSAPMPTLTSVTPNAIPASFPPAATQIHIVGTNFLPSTVAQINYEPITTLVISATELDAMIPASFLERAGTLTVTVSTPAPGGGTSDPQTLTVTQNPTPVVIGFFPKTKPVGARAFTITLVSGEPNGRGTFGANGAIVFGTTALPTTVLSATRATATVPENLLTTARDVLVSFENPAPGGGTAGQLFAVTASGACDAGYYDVDSDPDNGCETFIPAGTQQCFRFVQDLSSCVWARTSVSATPQFAFAPDADPTSRIAMTDPGGVFAGTFLVQPAYFTPTSPERSEYAGDFGRTGGRILMSGGIGEVRVSGGFGNVAKPTTEGCLQAMYPRPYRTETVCRGKVAIP